MNGWERLLSTYTVNPEGTQAEPKQEEKQAPKETPQGDSAVIQAAPKAKRTRKTKPEVEQKDEASE